MGNRHGHVPDAEDWEHDEHMRKVQEHAQKDEVVEFKNDFGDFKDEVDPEKIEIMPTLNIQEKRGKLPGSDLGAAIVVISLRCEELHTKSSKPPNSFAVLYSKLSHEEGWVEMGKSETINECTWPNYQLPFKVPFSPEVVRLLRVEIFRLKDAENHYILSHQAFIGGAECRLIDAIYARGAVETDHRGETDPNEGWLVKELLSPKDVSMGRIAIWAEENSSAKNMVSFNMSAKKLRYTDMWKIGTDAYFVIQRTRLVKDINEAEGKKDIFAPKSRAHGQVKARTSTQSLAEISNDHGPKNEQAVLRSEVVRRKRSPSWKRVSEISAQDMCHGDAQQPIVIEVWDWFRTCKPRLIGQAETSFEDMYANFWKNLPLSLDVHKKKTKKIDGMFMPVLQHTGDIVMDEFGIERRFSFLDFVRGGVTITPIIAVDMTRGNGDPRLADSLHRLGGDGLNDYATSIKALCDVLLGYQGHGKATDAVPIYGYGAKIAPTKSRSSNCFSLSGDNYIPFAVGIDGILDAYHSSIRTSILHGPTKLQDTIRLASDWARPYAQADALDDEPGPDKVDQRYFVLIILSKGAVEDQQETLNEISKACGLPLSIIVIGMGDGDPFLESLNAEVKATQQLNLKVSCSMGHDCHQVAMIPTYHSSKTCEECHCKVTTCKTRWDCETCGQTLCETCSISKAQKEAKGPVHRSMVTYKHFNEFRGRPVDLAASALATLPEELVAYYKTLEVKPRGLSKFETDQGLSKPRPKIDRTLEFAANARKKLREKTFRTASKSSVGSGASSMMRTTGMSSALHDGLTDKQKKEEFRRAFLGQLVPDFLNQRRVQIGNAAHDLGYARRDVERALTNGIAEGSIECLVDNIVHCSVMSHNSACLTYRAAAEEAIELAAIERLEKEAEKEREEARQKSASKESQVSMHLEDIHEDDEEGSHSGDEIKDFVIGAGQRRGVPHRLGSKDTRDTNLSGFSSDHGTGMGGTKESFMRSMGGTKESFMSRQVSAPKGILKSRQVSTGTKDSGVRSVHSGMESRSGNSSKEVSNADSNGDRSGSFALPGGINN